MKNNTLELLTQETTRLLNLQAETLTEALTIENFLTEAEDTIGAVEVKAWISHLENERQKLDKLEMVLAVIGTMKAGKSTTINAIVGMEILPNRETAMTTLPTLIRNKHGQTQPVLTINKIQPLLDLGQQVAESLNALDEGSINQIDLNGIEDGKQLIKRIKEQGGYDFATEYQGAEAIFEFLRHLNDLMRLAKDKRINIEPPYREYENVEDLPVIEVEFCHLKDHQDRTHGSLAILDTPGPNEFGQSEALRQVFKAQMEKASAVLLVTDFTQMKTKADQEVRDELAKIGYLSKDRLTVIVNKYDQANKNSMSKDEIKKYVAGSLMQGKIDIERVFPVSSYFAYLSSHAKTALLHHGALPDYKQQPWVADFGDIALGRRWESKINDIEEVHACIEALWEDSHFAEPVEIVIKEAHATAASKSLDSAIKKLDYYNNEFLNRLNLRSVAMSEDVEKIEQMMANLQNDIDNCDQVKQSIHETTENCFQQLEQEMTKITNAQKATILETIEKYFQEGKKMEKSEIDSMLAQKPGNSRKSTHFSPMLDIWGFSEAGQHHEQIKEKTQRRFDPNSPKIKFDSNTKANELTQGIAKDVADVFKEADEKLNSIANDLIKLATKDISQQINQTIKKTLNKAQEKLQDDGIKVNFKLPDIDLAFDEIDASALFEVGYQEKTENHTHWRKSKIFGFLGWFNDDWGWTTYTSLDTVYEVDIEKIKNQILVKLQDQTGKISNQTSHYMSKKFQPEIDEHLTELVNYLERYRGVLGEAIRSNLLDQGSKTELLRELEELKKRQTIINNDVGAVTVQ